MKLIKRRILGIVVILVTLGIAFIVRIQIKELNEYTYFMDMDKERISKDFDILIDGLDRRDRSNGYFFGVDKQTEKEKYVIISYVDEFGYSVLAEEGISSREAISIVENNGYKVNDMPILTWDQSFSIDKREAGEEIKFYLYWSISTEPNNEKVCINFMNGSLRENLED